MAAQTLKRGFTTDVSPILAQARVTKGAAIDPVGAYRKSGYRAKCAANAAGQTKPRWWHRLDGDSPHFLAKGDALSSVVRRRRSIKCHL